LGFEKAKRGTAEKRACGWVSNATQFPGDYRRPEDSANGKPGDGGGRVPNVQIMHVSWSEVLVREQKEQSQC
jgi:hypothetical protein